MIAGIEFTVYQDYSQYLTEENDYEYDKALEVLNEQVKKLVENNELTFMYGRKRVNPILPIKMRDTGNIFDEDDYDGPNWEGIRINCVFYSSPYNHKGRNERDAQGRTITNHQSTLRKRNRNSSYPDINKQCKNTRRGDKEYKRDDTRTKYK